MKESAALISLFYLAVSSLMVILNNEAHFYFYKAKFSDDASPTLIVREEIKYYEGLVLHGIVFSILVAVLTYFMVGTLWLAVVVFILILLEKVFDEVQRYLQFAQLFIAWSKLMLVRQLIPFFFTVAVILGSGDERLVTITYFLVTFIIFLIQSYQHTSSRQRKVVLEYVQNLRPEKLKEYFNYYRKKLILNQLQSFSTRNVPLLDRVIIRLIEKDFLAVMSVISQMGSLCILFVDYFLISHRRKEYLESGRQIFDIASPLKVLLFWMAALSIFLPVVGGIYFSGLSTEISTYWKELIIVGFYYSIYAISQHFVNFNFWNRARQYTLGVDFVYYLVCTVVFLTLPSAGFSLLVRVAVSLVTGHLLRLTLQVGLAVLNQTKTDNS
jgi:hypothetical protein